MSIPATSLIAMPQDMTDVAAALTEPAAAAWHAINLSLRVLPRPIHECRVLVIGGGAIGMLAALLLKHLGSIQLTVSEPNTLRRKAIKTHVGCRTLNPSEQPFGSDEYDYVFDAVGATVTRQQAFAAVKPGGVIMHVGLQDWASEIDMRKLTLAEITLLGSYNYTTPDLRATVAALHTGVFGDLAWVEQRPLTQGPQAFQDLHEGRTAAAKIVLWP